jgi:hypothetical protein
MPSVPPAIIRIGNRTITRKEGAFSPITRLENHLLETRGPVMKANPFGDPRAKPKRVACDMIIEEIYDALIEAGASEEKARCRTGDDELRDTHFQNR